MNLVIILIIVFGWVQGGHVGSLFHGLVEILIFFFSAIFAVGFFRQLSEKFILGFLVDSTWTSCLISFWAIYFAFLLVSFLTKNRYLTRYEVMTYPALDSFGSRICGALSGVLTAAVLVFTLRMVPFPERMMESVRFLEKPVILKIDEIVPRCYGCFVTGDKKYSFRKFMELYNYRSFFKWKKEKKEEEPYWLL